MLKWCSFCQQFQGEIPPYGNYSITHGMCSSCSPKGLKLGEKEIEQSRKLKDIQNLLVSAGQDKEPDPAELKQHFYGLS